MLQASDLADRPVGELKAARAQLDELIRIKENTNKDQSSRKMVNAIMAEVLGQSEMPLGVVKKQAHYSFFREGCDTLEGLIQDEIKPSGRAETSRCIRYLLEMLRDHLSHSPAPVCHKVMSTNLPKILPIVDQQFPGYRRNGLIGIINRPRT